jgi:hypothetical protein
MISPAVLLGRGAVADPNGTGQVAHGPAGKPSGASALSAAGLIIPAEIFETLLTAHAVS